MKLGFNIFGYFNWEPAELSEYFSEVKKAKLKFYAARLDFGFKNSKTI